MGAITKSPAERAVLSLPSFDFQFAGHGIRVAGPDALLTWLDEFITPQIPRFSGAEPDRVIHFSIDPRRHAELTARGPCRPAGRVDCFTLDTRIHAGTRWNDAADTLTAFDETARVFYRRRSEGRGAGRKSDGAVAVNAVEAVAPRDTPAVRVALMRMVREFAMMDAARAGWLLLHAAAVGLGDRAILIAGPKRSGKTTVLLHALLQEGGTYIANDRVAVRFQGAHAFVHGIPTIVSVREGTAALFPAAATALAGGGRYHFSLTLEESSRSTAPSESRVQRWQLSPRQFCHRLGVESRAAAPLSALIFPEIVAGGSSATIEALASDQVAAALNGARLRPLPRAGMFSIDGTPDGSDTLERMAARVAGAVPGFRCAVGPEAYANDSRWLGRLPK